MLIDCHAHAASDYATGESIKAMAAKYGIEKVVLVTGPKNNRDLNPPPNFPFIKSPKGIFFLNRMLRMAYKSFKDNGDGNHYVLGLAKKLPDLVIPFLYVNPLDTAQMSGLEAQVRTSKAKGIKLHQAWDAFSIDRPEFGQVVDIARSQQLPIFIHLYSAKEARKLVSFIGKNREVTFIIAHMLGLDAFSEKRNDLPNIYFDTSGSERVRAMDILTAIDLVGDDHVLFGSDTPYASLADQINKIDSLGLTSRVKEQIFKLNAQRLLALN